MSDKQSDRDRQSDGCFISLYPYGGLVMGWLWRGDGSFSVKIWQRSSINKMQQNIPDSKVHGANMGPIWGWQVGPMLAPWTLLSEIWPAKYKAFCSHTGMIYSRNQSLWNFPRISNLLAESNIGHDLLMLKHQSITIKHFIKIFSLKTF